MASQKRTKYLNLRVLPSELARWKKISNMVDESMSDYIRIGANEREVRLLALAAKTSKGEADSPPNRVVTGEQQTLPIVTVPPKRKRRSSKSALVPKRKRRSSRSTRSAAS